MSAISVSLTDPSGRIAPLVAAGLYVGAAAREQILGQEWESPVRTGWITPPELVLRSKPKWADNKAYPTGRSKMKRFAWFSFWLVAAIWGSSFLLIRVGVEQFTPGQVAFIRCVIAAVGLNAVLLLRGKRYPTDPRIWVAIVLVGIGNASLPYWLIGLSEQIITSSLASVIQATVPLFSLVIAHFMLADERITPPKIAGLVLGFIGVSVLALRQGSLSGEMTGVLLMVLGSFFYGLFAVFN
ncbi:MAG: EamA family transporter, partial [Anaerolineae bacterium]|nr:EamA family transporter [Anaerolineae bacterium]